MFTRKEKNMLFDPYFEVIRETEQFIEVRSVNTGHCLNILATRNRESGNLEIGVPVLGNRLFCA